MFYSQTDALTYDDVLLVPGYSEVLPSDVELKSRFSRNITVNLPIVSSAMDTVTESRTAIVMAQEGGLGVIHKNFKPDEQATKYNFDTIKPYGQEAPGLSAFRKGQDGAIYRTYSTYAELSLRLFLFRQN